MSIVDTTLERLEAVSRPVRVLLDAYGMGTIFAANVLGAGSVYILAQTGASTGFSLLWVLPVAFALDIVMHDMSARMATRGEPLMAFIRRRTGGATAKAFGLSMALVMQLWSVANYAVAGFALAWFVEVDPALLVVASGLLAVLLIATGTYAEIELLISALMVIVFGAYASLTFGLSPSIESVTSGFVPSSISDPALVIAMLGTTVYYPNFFIQSSMRPTKKWQDLSKYRRDNVVGIGFSVLVSIGMLTVAAVALSPGELSLTDPAKPLVDLVGTWTLPVFMIAVFAASFTSATGTLFGSGFAVPQAFDRQTEFGDRTFRLVVVSLILLSLVFAVAALQFTNLTPVRMAIVMPAVNGAIFLPITIFAMFWATRNELGPKQTVVSGLAVVVMTVGSILTANSLIQTILAFL